MRFWPNVVRVFYSERPYVDARLVGSGWGIRYSVTLVIVLAMAVAAWVSRSAPWGVINLELIKGLLFALGIAILFRLIMLAALAMTCRLIAFWPFKLDLTSPQAARLTALAYTPIAVIDAAAFCFGHTVIAPHFLFAGGVLMLLAALNATK